MIVTAGTMLWIGYEIKTPCSTPPWGGQKMFNGCYTDIVPLYGNEGIAQGRMPVLEPCPESDKVCDEYPVLQMWLMRAAGAIGQDLSSFFRVNAALLALAGLATAVMLFLLVGKDSLFFAAAPSLVLYAFHNWDLYAAAMATAAMFAFLRGKDRTSGVFLGIGASTKLFPALLLLPLAADRSKHGDRRAVIGICATTIGTWLAINLPFALLNWRQWSGFFRFHAERAPEWTTLWYLSCKLQSGSNCATEATALINTLSVVLMSAAFVLAWTFRRRKDPGFERWTLVFPAVVLFLLFNKVYSPQYSIWLLPMFALAFPRKLAFVAFSVTDVAVGRLLFSWMGTVAGHPGAPELGYRIAALSRGVVLATCVVLWSLGRDRDPEHQPAVLGEGVTSEELDLTHERIL